MSSSSVLGQYQPRFSDDAFTPRIKHIFKSNETHKNHVLLHASDM